MHVAEPPFSGPALDVMEEVFFAFTLEGEIIQWNRRLEEVTGYTDEEIKEMHPSEFVPAKERELIERHIEEAIEKGDTRVEAHYQTKEGELIPYEFTGTLFEHEGEALICGTGRDVSKRKQAKEGQETSDERFRRLFENAQEGIGISTIDGEIEEVNPAAAEIFGYSREEFRSMNAADLYADPEEREAAIQEMQEKGYIKGREFRLYRADGEEFICRVSSTPHRTEDGKPVAFQTFFRDVTERKEAEKALKESEEQFRTLAEGALVGIALIQDGAYKYVNPALAQITGYPREELISKSPESLVHADDWPYVREQVERRLEGETEDVHYETRIRTKSGETRYVEIAGSRIDYQGEPAIIGTMQDITERRELQQEVLHVQEEERRRLGQDLHDGVASQLTGANIMLSTLSAKAQAKEAKEGIQEVREIINESASDVRKLSRGLNPGGLSEGDLPSALKQLVTNVEGGRFESLLEDEGSEDDSEFPSLEGSLLEEDVTTHLYRIAQEAVNNARKYAEASQVAVRLREEDDAVVLEVEDDGTGFDPSASSEGLGLRSMRHRAELLGAALTIDSSPGEGTLVRCRLPV